MTNSRYAFKTGMNVQYCFSNDIMYCSSDSSQTHIFIQNSNKISTSKPLKEIEKIIDNNFFIKVNLSHIVNVKHIQKYSLKNQKFLTMSDGKIIKLSTTKIPKLISLFKSTTVI